MYFFFNGNLCFFRFNAQKLINAAIDGCMDKWGERFSEIPEKS